MPPTHTHILALPDSTLSHKAHTSFHSPSIMSALSTADTLLHLCTTPDNTRNMDLDEIAKRLQVDTDFRYVGMNLQAPSRLNYPSRLPGRKEDLVD